MITVDTVGSNLGTIVNCGSNIKKLLGYDKSSMVGKRLTKIMPAIYS
jgi:hypothetical protein